MRYLFGIPRRCIGSPRLHALLIAVGVALVFASAAQAQREPFVVVDAGDDRVTQIAFSPDSQHLVALGESGKLRTWPVREIVDNPSSEPRELIPGIDQPVTAFRIAQDSQRVAAGHADGTLSLINLISGEPIGHQEPEAGSTITDVEVSGKTITAVGQNQTIYRWTLNSPNVDSRRVHSWLAIESLSPNGKYCAGSGRDERVTILNLSAAKLADARFLPANLPVCERDVVAFDDPKPQPIVASRDGLIWQFDISSNEQSRRPPATTERVENLVRLIRLNSATSPFGVIEAATADVGSGLTVRLPTKKFTMPVADDQADFTVAFSNSHQAVMTSDNQIKVWPPAIATYSNTPITSEAPNGAGSTPTHIVEVFYGTDRQKAMAAKLRWLHHFVESFQHGMGLIITVVAGAVMAMTLLVAAVLRWLNVGRFIGLTLPLLLVIVGGAAVNAYWLSQAGEYYGNERGHLRMGQCWVEIPKEHSVGELESGIQVDKVVESSPIFVLDKLRESVQQSPGKQALLFVHGFNVSFQDAARRTAQLAYDLSSEERVDSDAAPRVITPIFFSWPSQSDMLGYPIDSNNAELAAFHLAIFLRDLREYSDAETVHLIAHSMGGRVLTRALQILGQDEDARNASVFKTIILAAPDIDAELFKSTIAPAIVSKGRRVTLYTSANDTALKLSKTFNGYPRAGDSSDGIVVHPEMVTIDVSEADLTDLGMKPPVGHTYYGDNELVIRDMRDSFKGKEPSERSLRNEQGYWSLVPTSTRDE